MPTAIMRFDLGWTMLNQRGYMVNYWLGDLTSGEPPRVMEAAFLGKLGGPDGFFQNWRATVCSEVSVKLFQCQFLFPQRLAVRNETLFWLNAAGFILGPAQAWHATCRIHWFSASDNPRPHWTNLAPVPIFGLLIGTTLADYTAAVVKMADSFRDGFTTVHGDRWRGCVRSVGNVFSQVIGSRVEVFAGRQKTRRRVF